MKSFFTKKNFRRLARTEKSPAKNDIWRPLPESDNVRSPSRDSDELDFGQIRPDSYFIGRTSAGWPDLAKFWPKFGPLESGDGGRMLPDSDTGRIPAPTSFR
jgi:hypothetical protein